MKTFAAIIVMTFIATSVFSQGEDEKVAIKKVIDESYVEAIQNRKNIENIEKGFHPGFNLLGVDNQDNLTKYP
ncbi:MAG: hypothetical protein V2I34_01415, partial [Bacteroidales bacterium]|nr:hypothetical protein [Bacteroidales bacterium]